MSRRYLLDANVFIEAKNRYYGFDICPGFWSSLAFRHNEKRLFSLDRIEKELKEQDDDVKTWVEQTAPVTFFKKSEDQAVVNMFQRMVQWVYAHPHFTDAAKTEFASVADGWLVAYAAVNGFVIVTHEQYAADIRKKVPIPNLCVEFEVEYADTFTMIRELGDKYIRSTKSRSSRGKSSRS